MASASAGLGRLGFIGCGTIVTSVVEGICALPTVQRDRTFHALRMLKGPLMLSPRGHLNTALLQRAHPGLVQVARSNQHVIDDSDTVVLGLTPQDAEGALAPLRFRQDQTVVSLMHGVSPDALAALPTSRAGRVVRVNPLPAVAHHAGIAAIWPPHADVARLFRLLGSVYEAQTLEQFHAMHAATTVMGPLYAMQLAVAQWLVKAGNNNGSACSSGGSGTDGTTGAHGDGTSATCVMGGPGESGGQTAGTTALDLALAQQYVADMFVAIAADARVPPKNCDFSKLVAEQTPGGLNEQNVRRLGESTGAGGVYAAVPQALDETLQVLVRAHAGLPSGTPRDV